MQKVEELPYFQLHTYLSAIKTGKFSAKKVTKIKSEVKIKVLKIKVLIENNGIKLKGLHEY